MDEFFSNFVHEFTYEICTNSYDFFLHEKLVMLRMACTVMGNYPKLNFKN